MVIINYVFFGATVQKTSDKIGDEQHQQRRRRQQQQRQRRRQRRQRQRQWQLQRQQQQQTATTATAFVGKHNCNLTCLNWHFTSKVGISSRTSQCFFIESYYDIAWPFKLEPPLCMLLWFYPVNCRIVEYCRCFKEEQLTIFWVANHFTCHK